MSFLEIYNEVIRDLLGSGKDDTKHDIRLVSAGSSEVYVSDLTTVFVSNREQVCVKWLISLQQGVCVSNAAYCDLTLPSGAGVLPFHAERSNGPSMHHHKFNPLMRTVVVCVQL